VLILTGADAAMPAGAVVALVVLGLIELALVVFCIVDIVRRPAVLGERKWVWIVIVLLFNLVGSIIYLAIGRVQPPPPETRADPTEVGSRVTAAADVLYGQARAARAEGDGGPGDLPTFPPPGAEDDS
jgi:hypothetical protein